VSGVVWHTRDPSGESTGKRNTRHRSKIRAGVHALCAAQSVVGGHPGICAKTHAEQGFAADALQRPLRSRFQARLKPSVGLRGIDNVDANCIVSAAAREAASVRELYTQLSQVEFDQRMQTDLRPFFHNESALKTLVQMKTHLWEYGVILDMQPALWFSNGLSFLIKQFNKAKECDKSAVQRSLAFWFPHLQSALARYTEAFHLENLDCTMPPHLLTRSAFRQLGDILEGCMLPFIRQVHSLFVVVGDNGLHHDAVQGTFGNLVSDLCTIPQAKIFYQDLLHGVPIHQWRNIAQHSSYECDQQHRQLTCTYGPRHNLKTLTLSIAEFMDVLQQTDRIFALHKIAVGFFTADNLDLLKSLQPFLTITKDTLAGILLSLFETHAFEVNQFDISGDQWAITLKDLRGRSKQEVKELLNHAARFTTFRSDVGLRFEVQAPDGHSLVRGEIRKREPN